jgi:cell division protein FtsW
MAEPESKYQRYDVLRINIDYYFIFIITLLLSITGIIMVASSSIAIGERYFSDPYWFIRRQIIWWVISFIVLILFSRINYRFYSKLSVIIILIVVGLLAVVLIPGFSSVVGGGRRTIDLSFFNIQPSELAKLALIIFISDSLEKRYKEKQTFKNIFWPSFTALLVITMLIFLEPDFGAAVVIWITVFLLFFIGNVRLKHIIGLGTAGLLLLTGYMFLSPTRMERIMGFINGIIKGTSDAGGINFQINQSLIALGSGNILGLGLGNSIQKYSYLPEANTDFIFAILGEEAGLIGTITIVVLFLLFAFFGIRVCIKTKDYYGRTVAGAITSMIIIQAVMNIGVVTKLLPVTGFTLPFISYGGSSLIVCMASAGILLNISRQNLTFSKKTSSDEEMAEQ